MMGEMRDYVYNELIFPDYHRKCESIMKSTDFLIWENVAEDLVDLSRDINNLLRNRYGH